VFDNVGENKFPCLWLRSKFVGVSPELKPARDGLQMAPSVLYINAVRSQTARMA